MGFKVIPFNIAIIFSNKPRRFMGSISISLDVV